MIIPCFDLSSPDSLVMGNTARRGVMQAFLIWHSTEPSFDTASEGPNIAEAILSDDGIDYWRPLADHVAEVIYDLPQLS